MKSVIPVFENVLPRTTSIIFCRASISVIRRSVSSRWSVSSIVLTVSWMIQISSLWEVNQCRTKPNGEYHLGEQADVDVVLSRNWGAELRSLRRRPHRFWLLCEAVETDVMVPARIGASFVSSSSRKRLIAVQSDRWACPHSPCFKASQRNICWEFVRRHPTIGSGHGDNWKII